MLLIVVWLPVGLPACATGMPLSMIRPSPYSGVGVNPLWAAIMNSFQALAGRPPPVTFFIDLPSSLPNQTPVVRLLVKPIKRASRKDWVVPDLPAACQPGMRADLPVPK